MASDHHRRVDLDAELSWRPLERTAVKDWARLLDAIEAVDKEEEIIGEDDLAEEFDDPNHDFERGSIAAYHGPDMVGYGVLIARSTAQDMHNMWLSAGVHPEYRRRGIGSRLLDWAERAASSVHRERFPALRLTLSGRALTRDAGAEALLSGRGYQPSRWFHAMTCDISDGVKSVPDPDGVRITGFTNASAGDALLVRNEAFRDHYDSTDQTPESWAHFLSFRAFRPGFSFLAYSGNEPVGMIIGHEYDAFNEAMGVRDLYIALVATRRGWRGQGIAAALLARALSTARADGVTSAALSVDADSLTGAVGVYERVGFSVHHTFIQRRKELDVAG